MTRNTTSSPDYSILEAFQTPIARPRPSLLYQCSLVLVTFAMVLLPLIYLALVGGAVWAVYYHAAHHWQPIMDMGGFRGGRIMILKFMIYFIPLFAGVVIVFFMFKPIFAGRPKRAQPLALNPMDNPLLYAFIEKICETVGAASPKRIDLDCELNASASFRRGLLSMSPNDMILTIGLPELAAAQSVAVTTTETSNQYFLGVLPLLMPLRLPDPVASADHESDAAELNQISAGLQHVAEQLAPIAAQYAEASHKLIQARTALRLLKAGVFIQPVEFALTEATVESARAAEAELVATRDGLRHSVREVGAALNRRLQLALSLRLSDRGEFGVDTVSAEQAGQLVSSLNQAADDYAHQQELMDSIAVLDKINALKDARGETPPMSKALAAQNDFVNSLCAPQSSPVAAAEHKPGLQLQVARRQHRVSAGDVQALRQKNLQWFADYGARIEELIQIALPVEGVVV